MTSKTNETLANVAAMMQRFDPDRLTQEVIRLGEDYAGKNAAAALLEETKKSVLAQVVLDYIAPVPARPMAAQAVECQFPQAEYRALCDPRYETHLELMVQARKEADIARVRYDQGKMRLELMRSLQSTVRQELRSLPSQT